MKNQTDMIELFKGNYLQAESYEKFSTAQVRRAKPEEVVTTIIDGVVETSNTAKAGDVVVMGTKGEEYIINEEKFRSRYQLESPLSDQYQECKATGKCIAYSYNGPDMEFTAAWGEKMIIKKGDYLATTDKNVPEVYRIEKKAFHETYRLEAGSYNENPIKSFENCMDLLKKRRENSKQKEFENKNSSSMNNKPKI